MKNYLPADASPPEWQARVYSMTRQAEAVKYLVPLLTAYLASITDDLSVIVRRSLITVVFCYAVY